MALPLKPSGRPSGSLSVRLSVCLCGWEAVGGGEGWGCSRSAHPHVDSTVFQLAFHAGAPSDLFIWPQNSVADVRKMTPPPSYYHHHHPPPTPHTYTFFCGSPVIRSTHDRNLSKSLLKTGAYFQSTHGGVFWVRDE